MNKPPGDESLQREALAELDQLLAQSPEERRPHLEKLASARPELHSLVIRLLGYEDAVNQGFMEPQGAERHFTRLSGQERLGPYRILRQLGEGGMGEVWLASRDDGLYEGQVAIKTLHPHFAQGAVRERFLREAQVLGRLAHSNIARLLDAGVHEGVVYLVLEYVVGRPIDVACDEEKLDVDARLKIFLQLCAAVAHAHSSLVIHRDIKPANVLLTADGSPKLLDFGIASIADPQRAGLPSDLTRQTGRTFTPGYASPEQILGQEITTATDVHGLGVLLYVLMTGRLPYDAGTEAPASMEHAILTSDPLPMVRAIDVADRDALARRRSIPFARLRRELGGDLENIVQKALKKRPEERYATVAAFADDIRRHLQGEPVQARPDSSWYRFGKFARRNRLAVGASLAVVVALGIGLAVSLWQLEVARRERQHAEEVKEFVASIFRSADPFYTGKESMSAADLLALAHDRIDRELRAKPEIAAELLNIVGESQETLEQYEAAKATLNKAIEIASRMQPPDELQIAVARVGLVSVKRGQGDYSLLRPTLAQALPILRAHLPASGMAYGDGLTMLADLEREEGNLEGAIAHSRESIAVLSASLGPQHAETILSWRNLALYLVLARKYEEAKPILERALRDARAMSGPGERLSLTSSIEGTYARLLLDSDQFAEGIAHLNVAIDQATQAYGQRSQTVVILLSQRMRAQMRLGELDAAIATARQAFEISEPGQSQARSLTNYGRYTLLARRSDAARELLRQAVEAEKQYDPGKGSWLPHAQAEYAIALALTGRFAEARAVIDECLPIAKESGAEGAPAGGHNALGLWRQLQFQWVESEKDFRAALELTSPEDFGQRPRTAALLGIGIARLELGQAVEAEEWFRQADESALSRVKAMSPTRAEILVQWGRALLAQQKTADALERLSLAHTYWQGFDAKNRGTGEAAYWLARGHLAANARQDARAAFTQAVTLLQKSPLPGDARLARQAREELARL